MKFFLLKKFFNLLIIILIKVTHDPNFPKDIEEAIRCGFQKADNDFINKFALSKFGDIKDKSGSCAIVTLIVGKINQIFY